jgi:2'-5' RNA ligase superfamily protein
VHATESAVIVAVPEAEPVVGRYRAQLDQSAARGVPAHITVLYPFLAPERIDTSTLDRLAEAVRPVPGFDCTLTRVAWFDQDVVWLTPEPDSPFRTLTRRVLAAFPNHPPYGGAFADPIPHLTVGHQAPLDVLRAAAEAIEPQLPIRTTVRSVRLIQGTPLLSASWHTVAELFLGQPESG